MLVVTIGIVGDFCRSAKEKMNPYGDKCIDLFLNILKNPNVDEIVKVLKFFFFVSISVFLKLLFSSPMFFLHLEIWQLQWVLHLSNTFQLFVLCYNLQQKPHWFHPFIFLN